MSATEIREKIITLLNKTEDANLLQEIYDMLSEDIRPYDLPKSDTEEKK